MKSPPIRRNVTPPTARPKDPDWFSKVPKVERGKSAGRRKRYRRVNPQHEPVTDGREKRSSARRNVAKPRAMKRRICYLLIGAALLATGFLLARM